MNPDDLAAMKAAIEAAESGDDSLYENLLRDMQSGTPPPGTNSVRNRNVSAEELAEAEQALIGIKADGTAEEKQAAMDYVAILRAAHREGEIEAGRRPAGVAVVTTEGA